MITITPETTTLRPGTPGVRGPMLLKLREMIGIRDALHDHSLSLNQKRLARIREKRLVDAELAGLTKERGEIVHYGKLRGDTDTSKLDAAILDAEARRDIIKREIANLESLSSKAHTASARYKSTLNALLGVTPGGPELDASLHRSEDGDEDRALSRQLWSNEGR